MTHCVIPPNQILPNNKTILVLLRPVLDDLVDAIVTVSLCWGILGDLVCLVIPDLVKGGVRGRG